MSSSQKGPSQFMYKRSEDALWYYWINGKQGHANGSVLARTLRSARTEIRLQHKDCVIDHVLHEDQYHE